MEPQRWSGISVCWTHPKLADVVVSTALGYLLYQQSSVPQWGSVLAVIITLRCIHVTRAA
ncbi:hypothetical protein [Streptomyces vietnamensis]|uniref:hypothetical protein n=1 Tax=Streptomyces vietnamensis TaxID=362257 RepID=UPI0034375D05